MTTGNQQTVLVAEDEESDAMIFRLAFQRAGLTNPLVIVGDGQEAVDYLSAKGAYAGRAAHPLPALVVLDLKMPRMNGIDVLTWLSAQSEFNDLPAVILSSSPDQTDIRRAKAAGARDYFVKPHGIRDLIRIIEDMRARWLSNPGDGGAEVMSKPAVLP
jgi:CheY-like chemotaxis protein